MQKDYEDDEEIDDEEQDDEEQEEEPLSVDNVNDKFDTLDDNVLKSITQKGFYVTYLVDQKVVDSEGDEIETDEDEEPKRQAVKRVGINELFDFSGDEVVYKEEYRDKNIIFCKEPGQIFYGKIDAKEYNDKNGDSQFVVVPTEGRFYNDGECEYAGYFLNGNKDYGVTIKGKERDYSFLTDYKADCVYEKHTADDLLLSFDDNDVDGKRQKSDFNKYSNALVFSSKDDCKLIAQGPKFNEKNKVKNIKIQINNGYKYDFSKYKRDYLDENGNLSFISNEEKDKMFINVDKIVETICSFAECHKDSLRTIEIVGMNNFGILEDKEGKKLINEILKKLKDTAIENNISVFFSNVGSNDIITEVEEHYKSGEVSMAIVDHGQRSYEKLNFSGQSVLSLNKEEYEKQLSDLGYYSNIRKSIKKENIKDCSCLLMDSESYRDLINDLRDKDFKEHEKKVEELEKKCEKIKDDKLQKSLTEEGRKKADISVIKALVIVISSVFLPFVGGFIAYEFFRANSKKRSTRSGDNDDQKTPGNEQGYDGVGIGDEEGDYYGNAQERDGETGHEAQSMQEGVGDGYGQNNDKITYGQPKLNLNDQNALKDIKVS